MYIHVRACMHTHRIYIHVCTHAYRFVILSIYRHIQPYTCMLALISHTHIYTPPHRRSSWKRPLPPSPPLPTGPGRSLSPSCSPPSISARLRCGARPAPGPAWLGSCRHSCRQSSRVRCVSFWLLCLVIVSVY